MKKYVYYCDRCRKQTEKPVRVYAHDIDPATDGHGAEHIAAVELCPDCTQKVIDLLHGGMTNYEAICKLYRDGKEMPDIELATGIPVAAISRVIAKEGLAAERYPAQPGHYKEDDVPVVKKKVAKATHGGYRGRTIPEDIIDKIVELRGEGMLKGAIAKALGLSTQTVTRHLKARGQDGD